MRAVAKPERGPRAYSDRIGRSCRWAGIVAAILIAAPAAAVSDSVSYPYLSGNVLIEVQNDGTFDSDDPANERNDLFTTTEPEVVLHFMPELSLLIHGVLEPVRDPNDAENRAFQDHGLFVEELHLDFETERFALFGGKFTPNFGRAWDIVPGIYGADFAEASYELAERIGFGGSINLDAGSLGNNIFSASLFFLDTSVLSESLFTDRPRTRLGDGGPSNTERPNSFALAVDGSIPALEPLEYHLAFVNQAKGRGDTADERGFAIGLSHLFAAGPLEAMQFFEIVHFENADAIRNQDRDVLTVALAFGWRSWNAAAAYSFRDTDLAGIGGTTDHQFQLSGGYQFDLGLAADIGWRILEEGGVTSHTIGALLTHAVEFSISNRLAQTQHRAGRAMR